MNGAKKLQVTTTNKPRKTINMTIEKTINGYYRISTVKNDRLITRLFIGYTRKEAIEEFKEYVKEELKLYITEQKPWTQTTMQTHSFKKLSVTFRVWNSRQTNDNTEKL